jgi:type IV pilus assembly protein PilM
MISFIPNAFGLDISERSIKVIWLTRGQGSFELASWISQDIPEGLIERGEVKDIEKVASYVRDAVLHVKGKRITAPYVAVSLPEEKSFLSVIQMPHVGEKELKGAIMLEAENYIPFPLEEVTLDFQVIPSVGSDAQEHLDVLIAALPRITVEGFTEVVKKSGFIPVILEPESIAIARSLIKQGMSTEPIFLLDFGASRATIIAFSGYSIRYTYSIPISSVALTKAISESMGISFQGAEKLKIEHGMDKYFENGRISSAMEPILEEFAKEIEKQLDFYQTHTKHEHGVHGKGISRIFLSGGGSLMPGFDAYLAKRLRLDIDFANPWVNVLRKRRETADGLPLRKSLVFTTAIGLSLAGKNIFEF